MAEEEQGAAGDPRSERRRKWEKAGRIVCLVGTCFYVLLFFLVARTGYLSYIGLLAGAIYVTPGVLSAIAGFAGKKRVEIFLIWLSGGMTILLVLVVSIAAVWPAANDSRDWKPYRFDDELAALEAERAVPDEDNAALRCEALFARLDVNDQPDFFFRGIFIQDEFYKNAWNGAEHLEAARWLDAHSWAIDELVNVSATGTFRWPLQADTYDEYTVPYKPLRRCVQLLIASANRALTEDRLDDAIAKYFCVIRIGGDLRQQMQPVDFRTGVSYEIHALLMIRHVLAHPALSERDMTRITQRLPPAEDQWQKECTQLLRFEKLRYMNLLARLYEVNREGSVRFSSTMTLSSRDPQQQQEMDRKTGRWLRLYWPMSMPLDPQDLHGMADGYFARFSDLLERDCPRLPNRDGGMTWSDAGKAMANFHRWFVELAFFREDEYMGVRSRHITLVTERRGTWLVLGLRKYRDEHGAWPESLDQIAGHVPAEAFLDPTAGDAFVYRLEGDGFRLYSKGCNRIDEGGRSGYVEALERSEDDIAIWPPYTARPSSTKSDEQRLKELTEIYGEDAVRKYKRQMLMEAETKGETESGDSDNAQ